MKKLSLEIKGPCPCPLAMNYIKNILLKNGVRFISYYYNERGLSVFDLKSKIDKNKIMKIIRDAGFIANEIGGIQLKEKEKIIEFFRELSLKDKIEVMKSIMPEFCKSLNREPNRRQEMMKFMMGFWEQGMGDWMGMMGK